MSLVILSWIEHFGGKSPHFELGRKWQNGHRLDIGFTHDASRTRSWVHTHNHARSAKEPGVASTL